MPKDQELKTLPETFGDRLKRVRRAEGLSQKDFAERIGEKEATLAAWEIHARREGLAGPARRISQEFGYDLFWLLYGSEQDIRDFAWMDEPPVHTSSRHAA